MNKLELSTEDYVSFETAKLLKEKGFVLDNITMLIDNNNKPFLSGNSGYEYLLKLNFEIYPAPTLQMAMKWLREVHNLHCSVDYDYVLGWYCQITSLKETVEYDYEEMKHYHPDKDNGFSSYEEACETAIKYCLENLI